jgi:tetratricopeptide (TPR) repeat protein
MPSILERLRATLHPEFEVERALASGGMGTVFLARDVALDRLVAIKIIRPEMATADATERFVREARALANLSHPNTVSIHRSGEAGGFFYYVMDYVEGETLAQRLERGPLARDELLKLGRDVLDALESVHAMDVVHRDIKPSNIFLSEGRALLADFGISTPSGPQTTPPGRKSSSVTGTPGYMPPEQAFGWEISPKTDLYAVGMVLFQAVTGRQWEAGLPDSRPDWSGVPHSLQPILRKALAWEPQQRWPDARSFRHALWHTRTTKYRRRTFLLTASGLAAGALIALGIFGRGRGAAELPYSDLAVLPFDVRGATDPDLGWNLAGLARFDLETFLRLTPTHAVMAWHDSVGEEARLSDAPAALHARSVATGIVEQLDEGTAIHLSVVDSAGRVHSAGSVYGSADDLASMGQRISLELARFAAPDRYLEEYRPSPALSGKSNEGLREFLAGERAFHGNAWRSATEHYRRAIELDEDFPLASWRLAEAWRWLLTGDPPPVDLPRLLAEHRDELGELDRRLIEAQLAPSMEERLRRYEEAVTQFPRDGYATYLYGEEIMHRGALIGVPLDSAAALLEAAVAKAPRSGPAWEHLVWVAMRLNRKADARRALDRFWQVAAPPEEVDIYQPPLLEIGYQALFEPARAAAPPDELLLSPTLLANFRLAAAMGAYALQAQLAALILSDARADRTAKAIASEAAGLALFALGRVEEALQAFDSAAAYYGTSAAALEGAEWRVVPPALGISVIPPGEVVAGRRALEELAADDSLAGRVAWALALDAHARGDTVAAAELRDGLMGLRGDSGAARLATQLEALAHAARGRPDLALEVSEPLLALDSAGLRGGDPFARAALHWLRGDWLEMVGRHDEADKQRCWYEQMEIREELSGEAEAAEIDWALGPYGEFRRAEAALERGDDDALCRHALRLERLWREPDPAIQPWAQLVREHAGRCQ